jgi:hypothetical protein
MSLDGVARLEFDAFDRSRPGGVLAQGAAGGEEQENAVGFGINDDADTEFRFGFADPSLTFLETRHVLADHKTSFGMKTKTDLLVKITRH